MRLQLLSVAAVALTATLSLSNCTQVQQPPTDFSADFGQTCDLPIASSDVKVICARAEGQSTGLKVLGLISVKPASETEAIKGMYDSVVKRGAAIEGESRHFVNKSIERSSKNFIIFSVPTVKASGDLVQYMTSGPISGSKSAKSQSAGSGYPWPLSLVL